MSAADVLDLARAAGVELSATPAGKLRWRCPGRLQDELRQTLTAHKAELIELLVGADGNPRLTLADADADEAEGRFWYPPPGTPLFFQDEAGRPCSQGEANRWTWAGASSWFRSSAYPPPPLAADLRSAG
jgi:hypothetical protein